MYIPYVIIQIIGWLGILLSQLYKVPQLVHTYRSKQAEDLSLLSIVIQTSSYVVWVAYAVIKGDFFYIVANILSFVQNIVLHLMKWYYRKVEHKDETSVGDVGDALEVDKLV